MKVNFVFYNSLTLILFFFLFLSFSSCSRKKENKSLIEENNIIVDQIANAEKYFGLHPGFEKAFAFLRRSDLVQLPVGRYEIDGDRLFCKIQKGPGRNRTEARLEGHRRYIDIQYVIAGTDEMGWKPSSACKDVEIPYDSSRDVMYFKDKPERWIKVSSGSFSIFFPKDAHAPFVSEGEIHKAVIKVTVDWTQN